MSNGERILEGGAVSLPDRVSILAGRTHRQPASYTQTMGSHGQSAGATWLNGHAWRDGEAPPVEAAMLHDRGFVLGDGLFETLVVRRGLPVLWRQHLDRKSGYK